jgi:hypothetical protein
MFEHGDFVPLIPGIEFNQNVSAPDLFTFMMVDPHRFGADQSFQIIFPDTDHRTFAFDHIIHTAEAHDQYDRQNKAQYCGYDSPEYPEAVAHTGVSGKKIFTFPFHFQRPLFIRL